MPYIKTGFREDILKQLPNAGYFGIKTEGELNFAITTLIDRWIAYQPLGLNYSSINSAVGVLECAKLELYRRLAAPYEDAKLKQYGEVYVNNKRKKR